MSELNRNELLGDLKPGDEKVGEIVSDAPTAPVSELSDMPMEQIIPQQTAQANTQTEKKELSATYEMDYYLDGTVDKPELLVLDDSQKAEITQKGSQYAEEYRQMMLLSAARAQGIDVDKPGELEKYTVAVVDKKIEGDMFEGTNVPVDKRTEMKEEIKPSIETPKEYKEPSIVTFTKNKTLVEDRNDSKLLERLKNRKRKGSGTTGFLHNTNLRVTTYSMDKPLKLKGLADGMMYASATTFHSEKMLIDLYDHTSVICKGGDRLSSTSFYENLSLEDLSDYLMMGLIASNKDGVLKALPMYCTFDDSENFKKKEDVCERQYTADVDLVRIYEDSVTDEMRDFARQYSPFNSFQECIAKSNNGKEEWVVFKNPDMDEVMIMVLKSPTVSRYFEIKRKIMEFVYMSLSNNISLMNIAVSKDQHFRLKSLDDKLLILSELDEEAYLDIVDKMNSILYMDTIYILPTDIYNQIYNGEKSTVQETSKYVGVEVSNLKDGEDGVVIIPSKSDAEIYYQVLMEMGTDEIGIMQDKIMAVSNKFDRPRYKFITECPTCGNRKTMYLSVIELFFIFLRLKFTTTENQ